MLGFGLICIVFAVASVAYPYWSIPMVIGAVMIGSGLVVLVGEHLDSKRSKR